MAKILVVDDEDIVRELLRMTLGLSHEVAEACDGPAALRVARGTDPDLAILDLNMPGGMSGLDVMAALKAAGSRARFIVLTGSEQDLEAAIGAGAFAYLTKPFSPLQLLGKVDEVLGER